MGKTTRMIKSYGLLTHRLGYAGYPPFLMYALVSCIKISCKIRKGRSSLHLIRACLFMLMELDALLA